MRKLKLFFACLLMAVLSIGQMWAEKVTSVANIESGKQYYIGATKSDKSNWYLSVADNGTVTGKKQGTAVSVSNPTNAAIFTFTSTSGGWTIQFESGKYLTLPTTKDNGKVYVQDAAADWTITNVSGKSLMNFKIGNYCLQRNTSSSLNFGSYASGQLDLWLEPVSTTPTDACAAPTFNPTAGAVLSGTTVALTTTTADADIYYTMGANPADPTTNSLKYENPIEITEATTIKAIAVKDGMNNSSVASASYTITNPLATMQEIYDASEAAGSYYVTFNSNWVVTGVSSNGQNVYITDGEKGMILYNNGGNMGLVAGNTLSGTKQCSITRYGGAPEISNFSIAGLTKGTGTLPAVQELSEEEVAALGAVNTGALIKVSGEYTAAGYVGGAKLYNAIMGTLPSMTVGSTYECTGVYIYYKKNNTTDAVNEIAPRTTDDIKEVQPATLTEVNGLAELKAAELGSYLVTLNNAIVTYADDKNVFIEEANAGSLIYYQNGGHGLEAGDCLNGKYEVNTATYNGKFEITSITAQTGAEKTTAAIPVTTLTIAQLTADFAAYESMRIKIAGVNVTNAIATDDRNGEISDGTNTFILYAGKNGVEAEEDANIDVIGYPTFYVTSNANQHQLAVWAQADITVNVKEDSELAWSAESVELTVGDEFTAPTLQNPNNIDAAEISIESNNIDLATVENGVVSLVENATGEATITATFNGNATYNATQVSYTISVLPATLTDYYQKVTATSDIVEGTYLIVYEGDNTHASVAFDGSLETLEAVGNNIPVTIVGGDKIAVSQATEAATFYIDVTAGSIQSASGKYIGANSYGNRLDQSENADAYVNALEIDADGNAVITLSNSSWSGDLTLRYNYSTNNGERFRYYKSGQQPIALYKLANEVTKLNPELAWDKESIELTVGGLFISPELIHAQGITGTISYVSDNENVATVENGVISLVENATGTAHITASYAGDENYKPGSAVCTIKVNPAYSIYVDKLNVNFGSVAKDADAANQTITVTLTNVDAATATLSGSGASAYSIDPAALTASGTITISASSATAGTFAAKLTISDDAGVADSKVVNLSLTVTDPAAEETPISTTSKWVAATAADLVDGAEVIITGVKDEVVYAMGEQKSTNRAAYVASVDGEGVLTPGEGTMSFTLVAQEAEGVFALRTSDGKYLYAAASGSNHLKTQDNVDVNAQWTLTATSAVAESSTNRNIMRFNGSGTNKLFSCYSSGQTAIQFYVPKPVTPPTPVYETVRAGLAANRYYTLCFNRTMTAVQGATFWTFASKDVNMAYLVQEDAPYAAGKPYIIYAEAAGDLTAVLSGDVETNPGVNGALHGTFSLMEQTALDNAGENIYLLMNNELRRVDGQLGNSLPAYRAYIDLDEIDNTGKPANVPAHRVRAIPMHKDVVTGFENLNATDKPVKMLIDGNIYILRGEKMYDATGRLVK